MAPDLEPKVTLPWLVRFRWLALAGQAAALLVARWAFELELVWWLLSLVLGASAVSNLALAAFLRRQPRSWSAAHLMGGVVVLDIMLLTALLAASGGPTNPFTVFYLVHITITAVVLSARWTSVIAALSVAGYGLLFLLPASAQSPHHAHAGFDHHLQGMWVAFVLAAGLTAFFVRRVARAIAFQREQIAALRESSARNARLAALTTLAAGAAHELGRPLGTIAVAAHEARLAAEKLPGVEPIADDLRLILLEVERCQEILGQMAARASQDSDDAPPFGLAELVEKVRAHLGEERSQRVDVRLHGDLELVLPREQMVQSIVALIKNALDASAPADRVAVDVSPTAAGVRITVEDRGSGIPEHVLAKVGEPFFTTKQPGRGLGLGVFLARAFVESRGGALVIESTPGVGTRAIVRLPGDTAAITGAAA
jgi:two-component system sensor histidine kinase RegB